MNNPVSIGTVVHGTGNITSLALTTTAAVASGDAILVAAYADGQVGDSYSFTDQVGNTYSVIQIADGAGFAAVLGYCASAIALPSGDTITLTNSAGPMTFVSIPAAKVPGGVTALDKSATATQGAVTALSVGPTAATTQLVELVFVLFGVDSAGLVGTFTPGGSDTALAAASASGTFTFTAYTQYRVTAATGTQTSTATLQNADARSSNIVATFTNPPAAPAGGRVPTIPKLATIGTP